MRVPVSSHADTKALSWLVSGICRRDRAEILWGKYRQTRRKLERNARRRAERSRMARRRIGWIGRVGGPARASEGSARESVEFGGRGAERDLRHGGARVCGRSSRFRIVAIALGPSLTGPVNGCPSWGAQPCKSFLEFLLTCFKDHLNDPPHLLTQHGASSLRVAQRARS